MDVSRLSSNNSWFAWNFPLFLNSITNTLLLRYTSQAFITKMQAAGLSQDAMDAFKSNYD